MLSSAALGIIVSMIGRLLAFGHDATALWTFQVTWGQELLSGQKSNYSSLLSD